MSFRRQWVAFAIAAAIVAAAPAAASAGPERPAASAAQPAPAGASAGGQCERLRKKLARQRVGLGRTGTEVKAAHVKRNVGKTKGTLRRKCKSSQPAPPNPVTANRPPAFTSSSSAAVAENSTAVMTVAATDPDGDTPSFAITGGADQARFAIDPSSGALSFVAPPDFEAPTDAGADNVYDVTVTASDARGGTTSQAIPVTVTDVGELFTVGGTVIGLDGGETVVLQNNGGDNQPVNSNGTFTFPTPVADGSPYNVTVLTQPIGQTCTVSNGSGTINGANVTNVGVNCVQGP